nr:MAG TPA: hypothetical protein [Caudoviricetes sp.]
MTLDLLYCRNFPNAQLMLAGIHLVVSSFVH